MSREKGSAKTGGRKKGVSNKDTANLRLMIHEALQEVGGAKYLVRQSEENPTAFMTLLGKVIPVEVAGSLDLNIRDWTVKVKK